MAASLAETLAGELVFDPQPDGLRSPWRTYRRALELTPESATHRLIVQDDAVPCPWFSEAALAAIQARPDDLVVFFVGGRPDAHAQAVWRACREDQPWARLRFDQWCPAVAVAWPVRHIEPFLEFVDSKNWRDNFTADDEIICRYLQEIREHAYATVPSLIEHPDVAPSIRKSSHHRALTDLGRVAACFISDECDAREIDWNVGL